MHENATSKHSVNVETTMATAVMCKLACRTKTRASKKSFTPDAIIQKV